MKTRVISGIAVAIVLIGTMLAGGYILGITLLVASLIAYYELSKACGIHTTKINALELPAYIGIVTLYALIVTGVEATMPVLVHMLLILFILAELGVYVFTFPKYKAPQVMAAVFCALYAPLMLAFVAKIRALDAGIYFVILVLCASSVSDVFAYFVGVTLGKHKLAPVLSPKKSIEGAVGGVFGAVLVSAIYAYLITLMGVGDMSWVWKFAIVGGAGSIISQIGDLAASAIKRNHDIKDYGHLIPGHGGIMDRVDSIIVTAPLIYYLLLFLG